MFGVVRQVYIAAAYDYAPTIYFSILKRAGGGGGGGGGRSGGGGGGGGSGGPTRMRGRGLGSGMPLWLMILLGVTIGGVVFLVIFLIVRSRKKAKRAVAESAGMTSKFAGQPPPSPEELAKQVAAIREHDGAFDDSRFVKWAEETFFKVQESWTERQAGAVRELMGDACFADHEKHINEFLAKNQKNVLEDLAVTGAAIMAIQFDKKNDTVTVRFNAQCADYAVNVDTGELVTGSKAVGAFVEDWVFERMRPDHVAGGGEPPGGGLDSSWRLMRIDSVSGH